MSRIVNNISASENRLIETEVSEPFQLITSVGSSIILLEVDLPK